VTITSTSTQAEFLTTLFNTALTPKIRGFIVFLRSSAAAHNQKYCKEMAGDRLRQLKSKNCYILSRVSWALAQFFVKI